MGEEDADQSGHPTVKLVWNGGTPGAREVVFV